MNKKLKRSFLAAGIVVGVCALVWGGLTLLRNGSEGVSGDGHQHDGLLGRHHRDQRYRHHG